MDGVYCDVSAVQTNIILFNLEEHITNPKKKKNAKALDHKSLAGILKEKYNILVMPTFTDDGIRMVTHCDVSTKDMESVKNAVAQTLKDYI